MPPDERRGPAQQPGPRRPFAVPRQVASIVPDRVDHRRRQVRRLAVIAQVRAAYGPAADLVSPPGPDCCPDDCRWCAVAI
jgi:hypothetical protein